MAADSSKKVAKSKATDAGFSAEERAAMKERARELRQQSKGGANKAAAAAAEVVEKIKAMTGTDREIAEGIHALVAKMAPQLEPRTWYGMPAYAKAGKVVFFFQEAAKFKSRYATLGFSDSANLDDGASWATSFAVISWNTKVEKQIRELIERAITG